MYVCTSVYGCVLGHVSPVIDWRPFPAVPYISLNVSRDWLRHLLRDKRYSGCMTEQNQMSVWKSEILKLIKSFICFFLFLCSLLYNVFGFKKRYQKWRVNILLYIQQWTWIDLSRVHRVMTKAKVSRGFRFEYDYGRGNEISVRQCFI